MVWCISSPYLASSLQRHCLTPAALPRTSWGGRSEYPLSILRNLTRPPPCFCVVCTPSPLEGWLGTAFYPFLIAVGRLQKGKKGQRPLIPAEFREKCQKKAVFRGPAGPRKRGLFWTLPRILKASKVQALWL